jgi:hypothetical protein
MFDKIKDPYHLVSTKAEFIELIESFIEGDVEGSDCVAVYFELPGLNDVEIIINPRINVPSKLDYYVKMYNDNLELNTNSAVKIIGVSTL